MTRQLAILMVMALMSGCSTVPKSFSPLKPMAPQDVSHSLFEEVLRTHVVDGRVNYPGIQTDERFKRYLEQLDRIDPNTLPTRNERLAFWINAYNAYAVQGILDRYSPMTLVGRYRYFIAREYRVGGETINLYDLERNVLIPEFREPRVHFAIVCASSSCPKLQSWVYNGAQLDRQLDQAARMFINDPARNQFDRQAKVARLSMIFKWFAEDFEAGSGSVLNYVSRYVSDSDLANDLARAPYRVEFLEYDWSLNGPMPKERADADLS